MRFEVWQNYATFQADQILVEQMKNSHLQAFDMLIKRYQFKIYQIAYRFISNVDESITLTQEVFLKAYCWINQFNSLSTFHTWLYRIVGCRLYSKTSKAMRWSIYQ